MTSRKISPGILMGVGAYVIWGLLPAFMKLLRPMPAPDILANRILWSLGLLVLLAITFRRGPALRVIVQRPRLILALCLSALLIGVNWLCYIVAVNSGHVAEASLGYFINPLVNVVLGVVVLRERLGLLEGVAVLLAALAVLFLAVWQGSVPVLPLTLALSFGSYGLVRKLLPVDALDGLLAETMILAGPAALWLAVAGTPTGAAGPAWPLLAVTGLITALPLLLFAAAAKRLRYTDLGLLQYLAPTLQLVLAVFVYHERLAPAQITAFATIWLALALYVVGASRTVRRAAVVVPD